MLRKKEITLFCPLIILCLLLPFLLGCNKEKVPFLTTTDISNVTQTTANCSGNITSDGGAAITIRGVCWGTSENPTIKCCKTADGQGMGIFTSFIDGLIPSTTYFVRAYAINSKGVAYGNELSFKTNSTTFLELITSPVFSITHNSAISGGKITSDGGTIVTTKGVCWSKLPNPVRTDSHTTEETSIEEFVSSVDGLEENTTYYLRAYATNVGSTAYGNEISFTTSSLESMVFDVDGNAYNTVAIGTQTWLKENLKTTKYNDGSAIPNVTNIALWTNETDRAYCWFNNDIVNKNIYGALYNIYTVQDSRKICPWGWHVPSDEEWTTLENFLGEREIVGGKLKSSSLWLSPNTGANNSSGFSALPSGHINGGGMVGIRKYCGWWSSTDIDAQDKSLWIRYLNYNTSILHRTGVHSNPGYSVRCIKD